MINWLPTSKKVDQCINTITFNFINNTCSYVNEIFGFAPHCKIDTKMKHPYRKTNMAQKQFPVLVSLYGTACVTQIKVVSATFFVCF